jgi:ABC-type multidrug transport system fused ATPase/permease subunit
MNILEYFAFIENEFFLNFVVIFFSIGIYPFINFMTPLYLICLEGLKIFISWTLALYLFGNLRYAIRIAYFVKSNEKKLKLLEQNEIEEINNDNIELEENEIKDIETKEINNNESELEENEIKDIETKEINNNESELEENEIKDIETKEINNNESELEENEIKEIEIEEKDNDMKENLSWEMDCSIEKPE